MREAYLVPYLTHQVKGSSPLHLVVASFCVSWISYINENFASYFLEA